MRTEWTEGKLEFDFTNAFQTAQPDLDPEPLTSVAPPLKSMDFYVWMPKEFWLVEVKDPEGAAKVADATKAVYSELLNDALLKEHLLPKVYGAYVHLFLEGCEPREKVRYKVVIGLSTLTAAERNTLTDKIRRVIKKVGPQIRMSRYFPEPEVHNVASWNAAHPTMQITRHP